MILLSSLIILIILMGITLGKRENATWPERFLRDTVSLGQNIVSKPAYAIADFFERVRGMYRIYEENRVLKSNLDRFAQLSADVTRLKNENDRLREMLDAKTRYNEYRLHFAQVIGRSPDRWNQVVIIDLGEKHGIKNGMVVISSRGMVGRVQSTSNFSSKVELLSDIERGNYLSAIIEEIQEYGVIEGYDATNHYLIMNKIPMEAEIKPGQQVTTSGLGDPVIPPGIIIGEVVEVVPGEYGLTQMAYIKPNADFYRIHEVFVVERLATDVLNELGTEDSTAETYIENLTVNTGEDEPQGERNQ